MSSPTCSSSKKRVGYASPTTLETDLFDQSTEMFDQTEGLHVRHIVHEHEGFRRRIVTSADGSKVSLASRVPTCRE